MPLDHRAIRNTLVPGVARSARCAVRLVDPKGLEPSHRRVRAAASASRGSGSVLRNFAVCFPCRVVSICLNVDLLRLFQPFVSTHLFNLFDLKIHLSPAPSGRCPRVCASRPRRPSEELIASPRERPVDRLRPASRIAARALVSLLGFASRWSVSQDPENEKADSAFGGGAGLLSRPLDRWRLFTSWSCSAELPRLLSRDATMIPRTFGATILATAHLLGGDVDGGPEGSRGAVALRGVAEIGQEVRHGRVWVCRGGSSLGSVMRRTSGRRTSCALQPLPPTRSRREGGPPG